MKGATVLKFAATGLAATMILATLGYWILHTFGVGVPIIEYDTGGISERRLSGPVRAVSSLVSAVLFVGTMICVARLASMYEKEDFFSKKSTVQLRRMALFFLLYALTPIIVPFVDQLVSPAIDGTGDKNLFIVVDLPKIGMALVAATLFGLTRILELAADAVQETKQFL